MEERAQRIVVEGLKQAGWDETALRTQRKGHPIKVRLARRLRKQSTVTLKWIAQRLCMGTWAHLANLLRPSATAKSTSSVKDKDWPEWR